MTEAAAPQGRRFSIAHLVLIGPWVALVIDAWNPIRDNSFLWHVRAGTVQADMGQVLTADPFSFTMLGEPWRTQSWLAELLYGWAEGFGGLGFVPLLLLSTGTLTFLAIGLVAYRRSRSVPATAFVLVLSVLALISFLVPRPVLLSYLLMALVVLAWDRRSVRWTVPFLFWVWAAVHASFIVGLAYVGLMVIMKRDWRELPKAVASSLLTLATAHGLGVAAFLLDFGANSDALQYLTEWRSPEFLEPVFLPFLGGLIFIVVGAFRDRVFPKHLWLIVPFALLGVSSVRAIPPAWLGIAPLVALSLSRLDLGSRAGLRSRLAMIFALVVIGLPFLLRDGGQLDGDRFPVEAISRLSDLPTFHDDVVGGFLIWAEGPERKVYIDDRAELYGSRLREFIEVRSGDAPWEPVFERDEVSQALLANEAPLVAELRDAGWLSLYEDENFTVLRAGD